MSYRASILDALEARLSATVPQLASLLGVSTRTIANHIAVLNTELDGVAQVVQVGELRRLDTWDEDAYRAYRASLERPAIDLHSAQSRMGLIFHRLASAGRTVLVDDLAHELSVSRSTVNADLAKLRDALVPYALLVSGRPNSGVELQGPELKIRLAYAGMFFTALEHEAGIPDALVIEALDVCEALGLSAAASESVSRWFMVMASRLGDGFDLPAGEPTLSRLETSDAFTTGRTLAGLAADWLDIPVQPEEAAFMTLPLVGMRGPFEPQAFASYLEREDNERILQAILDQIRDQMGIDVQATGLREEFMIHLGFLLNRVRFGMQVGHDAIDQVKSRYPLAYQMASHARTVIEENTGALVADAEVSLLAAYFQVFLHQMQAHHERPVQVAAVYPFGKVEGELLSWQVREAVRGLGTVTAISDTQVTRELLAASDVVVARETCQLPDPLEVPVIRVGPLFDVDELGRKISTLVMAQNRQGPLTGVSWLGALIEADTFVRLSTTDYREALAELLATLEERGLGSSTLTEAMWERESRSTMLLGPTLAFPHVSHPSDTFLLAVGAAAGNEDHGGLLIVLLAVPEADGDTSPTLVGLYEEVIALGHDPAEVTALARCEDAHQFRAAMAARTTHRLSRGQR
ncbi:MAG: PRD domain-containing protein [Dermabacter sp.]|nr:PRD domain-containing protein [Dermabacter sp.]